MTIYKPQLLALDIMMGFGVFINIAFLLFTGTSWFFSFICLLFLSGVSYGIRTLMLGNTVELHEGYIRISFQSFKKEMIHYESIIEMEHSFAYIRSAKIKAVKISYRKSSGKIGHTYIFVDSHRTHLSSIISTIIEENQRVRLDNDVKNMI